MAIQDTILNFASSQNWIALAINLFLSTLIGGIVIVVLLMIVGKLWKEQVKIQNAFIMVFLVNLISIFGILAFISPFAPSISLFLPILVWIGLTKAFFPELKWLHIIVVGVIGYGLSIFLVPMLVSYLAGFVPF